MEEYIKVQYSLWFSENIKDVSSQLFKVELGKKLKNLYFFKLLLKTLDGKIKSRQELIDAFIEKQSAEKSETQIFSTYGLSSVSSVPEF